MAALYFQRRVSGVAMIWINLKNLKFESLEAIKNYLYRRFSFCFFFMLIKYVIDIKISAIRVI